MPRLNVDLEKDLKDRLMHYIMKKYGNSGTFYGKISEVVREALEEYLSKREA